MRYLLVLSFLTTACTCLVPVDELDGGNGGGSGGGAASAGGAGGGSTPGTPDAGCTAAADCMGSRPSSQWCGVAGGLGFSCVDHRCLWECNGGRVCSTDFTSDGGCITCGTGTPVCRGRGFCQGSTTRDAIVESSGCPTWPGTALRFDRVTVSGGGSCRYRAYQTAGTQELGTFDELASGDFLADFPDFGGTCTGSSLPTGLERWVFNCPACQFVLRF